MGGGENRRYRTSPQEKKRPSTGNSKERTTNETPTETPPAARDNNSMERSRKISHGIPQINTVRITSHYRHGQTAEGLPQFERKTPSEQSYYGLCRLGQRRTIPYEANTDQDKCTPNGKNTQLCAHRSTRATGDTRKTRTYWNHRPNTRKVENETTRGIARKIATNSRQQRHAADMGIPEQTTDG